MIKKLSASFLLIASGVVSLALPAHAFSAKKEGLVEPKLHLSGHHSQPTVALTFDACMGATDTRILDALVEKRIPATIFVTGRWLKHNPSAFATLLAHPELFEIEDHGAMHVPAVDRPMSIYGIKTAGSPEAVRHEVGGGAAAIVAAGGGQPKWYRDATAIYSPSAMSEIRAMGYRIGGYSINGDGGSLLGVDATVRAFSSAKDGDVIIAHINQPTHKAGEGVVKGIEALQKRGFQFVRLMDQPEDDHPVAKTGG
jgi:peptidoglycan/xylan/chitin deacetylase (PgdA/CDA1 family)